MELPKYLLKFLFHLGFLRERLPGSFTKATRTLPYRERRGKGGTRKLEGETGETRVRPSGGMTKARCGGKERKSPSKVSMAGVQEEDWNPGPNRKGKSFSQVARIENNTRVGNVSQDSWGIPLELNIHRGGGTILEKPIPPNILYLGGYPKSDP